MDFSLHNIFFLRRSALILAAVFLFSVFSAGLYGQDDNLKKFVHHKSEVMKFRDISLDSSIVHVDSCIYYASKLTNAYYLADALQMKGHDFFMSSELDSALVYSKKAAHLFQFFPDSTAYYISEYNLGNIYLALEDHIQALVQFRKVLRIVDDNFDALSKQGEEVIELNRAYCYVSIGMVYSNLGDYEGVLTNMHRGIKIANKIKTRESSVLQAVTLGNIGRAYYELGNFEKAESYAITGLEQKKMLGIENSDGYNYQVLAMAAYGRKKYPLALKYLKLADEYFEASRNTDELNGNKLLRAKCFFEQKKNDEALTLLRSIEREFDGPGRRKERMEMYQLMSDIYTSKGDYEKANEFLKITLLIKNEESSKNNKDAVEEFINYFEQEESRINDKLENYKTLQEKEKLELEVKNRKEKEVWIYSLFGVSVICLLIIILIIARGNKRSKKINQELSYSIDEKQILFKEVHHRVKNNFQIISSLLNLQQGIEENERSKEVLTDAQGRIRSMSLVHEMLYRKNEVKRIDFRVYTTELVDSIIQSLSDDKCTIEFSVECNNETFDLEIAVPLGLILNEAVTNCVKYAFAGKTSGKIDITLRQIDAKNFRLIIRDNGIGIPKEFLEGEKETLGIELINILSQQLGGEAKFFNLNGTEVSVVFNAVD